MSVLIYYTEFVKSVEIICKENIFNVIFTKKCISS